MADRKSIEEADPVKPAVDRRGFLKALGAGAGASSLVVAGVVAPSPALAVESAADRKKKRYQETDHVKTYYRTNRY